MLDKNLLVEEIAKKHKVVLSQDDPIFTVIYLHDVIFDQYTARMDATVQALAMDVEAITARYRENSRELAEQIVGKAVELATTEIRTAGNETAVNWREEMEKLIETQRSLLNATRTATRFACVAAGISTIALGGVIAAVIL